MTSLDPRSPTAAGGYLQAAPRTLWNRMGFGTCSAPKPDDMDEMAGFAPGWIHVGTVAQLSWRDRLRVLLSGRLMVDQAVKTDVLVRKSRATSAVSIMPPRCTWKSVGRYYPQFRCYRLGRLMWERGEVGDGKGYSAKLSLGLRPVLLSFEREGDGWTVTALGVRVHYLRSYGGRFV